ncbi:ATP-dependent DNA helicase PIF1 [Tanacetum coccineum]
MRTPQLKNKDSNGQGIIKIRCVVLYHNLCDAVTRGDTSAVGLGKRIVLPRTFTGSPRYMMHNYQDAMALCRAYRNLDLFITFTSNPKWPEISEMLAYFPGQKPHDRPKIGIHVELIQHCKCKTPSEIDDIISAEMPSPKDDPDGYKVVTDYMLHGPCGKDARNVACTNDGKCSKHFPKPFLAETFLDEDGYPHYRRRDNKVTFKKGKFMYDNKHVVPHNRYLLLKYKAHINVEWHNRSKAIKYLFKYLNKGPDRAIIVIEENVRNGTTLGTEHVLEVDKIKNYLNCQFLAPCEAVWRLFLFEINYSYPSVMQLSFHLPNQNAITLRDLEKLSAFLQREGIDVTMFTDWFELNKRDPAARTLIYANIPKHYVWHEQSKQWKKRKQRKCIGMIVYSSLASGEHYYLRMLLNVVRGFKGFEELMTVNKRLYATFKETCFAYGLLNDDKEWSHAIAEANLWALGPKLQDIFVTMLLFCNVSITLKLWEETWQTLSEDILEKNMTIGIVSLLLLAGRTAHSRFVIPLDLMENSTYCIKRNTQLEELMQEVQLIIWDEAPMTQRYAFESLDTTLRDILSFKDSEKRRQIFGGMTVLLGGDFRQIIPVIPQAKKPKVVQACINRSELWRYCKVFTLTRSMRVNEYSADEGIDTSKQKFNQWVLAVGDGTLPAKMKEGEDEPT